MAGVRLDCPSLKAERERRLWYFWLMSTSFEDLVHASGLTEPEFRLEFAVWLYERQRLALAQASHLAGVPLSDFKEELASRNIPVSADDQSVPDGHSAVGGPASDDDGEKLRLAIQHAIEIADAKTARALIAEGRARYPDDEWIARAECVMTAPEARLVERAPVSDPRADWRWLDAHSEEYRGQWVALKDGGLVAAAPSLSALAEAVPDVRDVFVTQVF
jgi:predicted HTH domain antitoxin